MRKKFDLIVAERAAKTYDPSVNYTRLFCDFEQYLKEQKQEAKH